jgi:hypothetical protein
MKPSPFGPHSDDTASTRPRSYRDRGLLVQGLLAVGLGAVCLLWPASSDWLRPIGSLAVLLGVVLLVVHTLVARHPTPEAAPTRPQDLGFDSPEDSPDARRGENTAPLFRSSRSHLR